MSAVRTATVVLGEFRAAAAGDGGVAHVAGGIDHVLRAHRAGRVGDAVALSFWGSAASEPTLSTFV